MVNLKPYRPDPAPNVERFGRAVRAVFDRTFDAVIKLRYTPALRAEVIAILDRDLTALARLVHTDLFLRLLRDGNVTDWLIHWPGCVDPSSRIVIGNGTVRIVDAVGVRETQERRQAGLAKTYAAERIGG